MELFWNLTASGLMLVFLALLAWRGLSQLGWLPAHWRLRGAGASPSAETACGTPPALGEQLLWAAAALAVQWAAVWLGWYLAGVQTPFLEHFISRFTTAGDSPHYLYLAQNGYAAQGEQVNLIVFYPMYPLAVRAVTLLTGSGAAAGLLVSQCCWAAAAAAMRRLAGRLCPRPADARFATALMLLFPYGFFALGVYTESLFLLVTLLALEALVQRRWGRFAAVGFAAALCRTQGVLLCIPAVFLWLLDHPTWAHKRAGWRSGCALLAPPAGLGVYLLLNRIVCGDFLAFAYYESIAPWYQTAQWVGKTVAQQWTLLWEYSYLAPFIYLPQLVLYFVGLAVLLAALKEGAPTGLLLYGGAYLGASYTPSWLISGGRYFFGGCGIFLLAAWIKNKWLRWVLLSAEAAALVQMSIWYMQGQAIM